MRPDLLTLLQRKSSAKGVVLLSLGLALQLVASASCAPTPPGEIPAARGQMVDFNNQPLAGAQIQLFAAQAYGKKVVSYRKAGKALLSISTDSQGEFDFSTIRPGNYFLEVRAGAVQRTLLVSMAPRPADRAQEIRVRLTGVECNGFEVTTG